MSCAKYPFLGVQDSTRGNLLSTRNRRSDGNSGLDRRPGDVPGATQPPLLDTPVTAERRQIRTPRTGGGPRSRYLPAMRLRKRRGQAISLVLAAHPVASLLVTLAVTVAAATSGRTGRECLLVAATVLTGQV